jgi:hypothetical protein
MRNSYAVGASLVLLAGLASSARANLLVNGDLEPAATAKVNRYNLIYLSTGSSKLPGWKITSGTVDLVPGAATGNPYWANTSGAYSLDLVGTPGVGSISQTVSGKDGTGQYKIANGNQYILTFDLAPNPESGPWNESGWTKHLLVEAFDSKGKLLGQKTYDVPAGGANEDMQWLHVSGDDAFIFTAKGNSAKIKLTAVFEPEAGFPAAAKARNIYCGPVLDNLVLELRGGTPIPEPASLGLLGAGAAALLLRRRRGTA